MHKMLIRINNFNYFETNERSRQIARVLVFDFNFSYGQKQSVPIKARKFYNLQLAHSAFFVASCCRQNVEYLFRIQLNGVSLQDAHRMCNEKRSKIVRKNSHWQYRAPTQVANLCKSRNMLRFSTALLLTVVGSHMHEHSCRSSSAICFICTCNTSLQFVIFLKYMQSSHRRDQRLDQTNKNNYEIHNFPMQQTGIPCTPPRISRQSTA